MQENSIFESSEKAEQAFYSAFEQRDINLMMSIWCKDCETVCIHPGEPRLEGLDSIRSSWEIIFNYERNLKFELNQKKVIIENNIAIHHVVESIFINNELQSEIIATNIYLKTSEGWKMVLHHASPEFQPDSDSTYEGDMEEIQTIH